MESRAGRKGIGFGAPLTSLTKDKSAKIEVRPEDLLKFGLIPEFIGRLPVITTVQDLDDAALLDILTKPKNALLKQYQKMFQMDGINLEFEQDALQAVVDLAQERGTGARGLRSIMENTLKPVMFEAPSRDDIATVIIHKDTVLTGAEPTFVTHEMEAKRRPKSA